MIQLCNLVIAFLYCYQTCNMLFICVCFLKFILILIINCKFGVFYIKAHYTIRMFNRIIIIKLFYNAVFLFITISQDMFIAYFFVYLYI